MERARVNFTIQLTPPSANHYKVPTRRELDDGRRIFTYTPETKAWFDAVAYAVRGKTIAGDRLCVEFCVYRGKGERGDLDNYAKCILDGLVKAKVFRNDDSVVEMHSYKERDRDNPRTEIQITEVLPDGTN